MRLHISILIIIVALFSLYQLPTAGAYSTTPNTQEHQVSVIPQAKSATKTKRQKGVKQYKQKKHKAQKEAKHRYKKSGFLDFMLSTFLLLGGLLTTMGLIAFGATMSGMVITGIIFLGLTALFALIAILTRVLLKKNIVWMGLTIGLTIAVIAWLLTIVDLFIVSGAIGLFALLIWLAIALMTRAARMQRNAMPDDEEEGVGT